MKGHIRERSPGHWAIVLDVRDPETGKRRRKWHSFKGTKREAQVACSRLISEISGGAYIEPRPATAPDPRCVWGDAAAAAAALPARRRSGRGQDDHGMW